MAAGNNVSQHSKRNRRSHIQAYQRQMKLARAKKQQRQDRLKKLMPGRCC